MFRPIRMLLSFVGPLIFLSIYMPGFFSLPTFEWGDPPVSVVASKCERLWVDDARNDPALECYLTSQTDRLCRTNEKDHLLWFISRYEKSQAGYNRKLMSYLMGVQVNMMLPAQKGADGKPDDTITKINKVTKEQALLLKQDENFVKALKMRTVLDSQLTSLLRKLALKGYVVRDDFGWSSPEWATSVFEGELKVKPTCPQPVG